MHFDRNREPKGLFIYKDKRGRNIYRDPFSQKAYIITDEKKERFMALNNVPLYGILAFVFAYVMFELNIDLSLALSFAVTLLSEWRFRSFLNSCAFCRNFRLVKGHRDLSASSSKTVPVLRAFLHLILTATLILSAVLIKSDDSLVYGGSIALAIAFLFAAVRELSVFITR